MVVKVFKELNKLDEENEMYPLPAELMENIVLILVLMLLELKVRTGPEYVNIVSFLVIFIVFYFLIFFH